MKNDGYKKKTFIAKVVELNKPEASLILQTNKGRPLLLHQTPEHQTPM